MVFPLFYSRTGGDKNLYAGIAKNLTGKGYVVVVPDYTKYLGVNAELMIDDVTQSLKWTLRSIRQVLDLTENSIEAIQRM
jgi:hypothetical protein